jgi:hypothetical protein
LGHGAHARSGGSATLSVTGEGHGQSGDEQFCSPSLGESIPQSKTGHCKIQLRPLGPPREKGGNDGDGDGTDGLNLDPLLIELLKKIPETEKGWPAAQRLRWFKTFAMNVSQIYDGDDNEPVEMKIDLEKKEAAN